MLDALFTLSSMEQKTEPGTVPLQSCLEFDIVGFKEFKYPYQSECQIGLLLK